MANEVSLPLTLLNFSALNTNAVVNLNWNTSNEINIARFEIERSADGLQFNQIALSAANNRSGENKYAVVDLNPLDGVAYYRLKMIDRDGSYRYSKVVTVNRRLKGLSVYPNPALTVIMVTHEQAGVQTLIQLSDASGKKLAVQKVLTGSTQTNVDISTLQRGVYIITLINGKETENKTFIKK